MNSRESVLNALNHIEPEKVPVDLGSTPSSNISAIAYNNVKKKLNINNGHTRIYDVVQQLAQPEEEILNRFGIDVIDIGRTFNGRDEDWYDTTLADGSTGQYPAWFKPSGRDDGSFEAEVNGEVLARMPADGTFFDQTCFPYLDGYPENYKDLQSAINKVLWAAFAHSPWDHANEPDFWKQLREKTLKLRESSDRALMVNCGCNLFEWGAFLRRMDNFMMDIMIDTHNAEVLLDALMEQHLGMLKNVCESVGDIVDVIRLGDDLGMNSGPFMSPEKYRELFKPRHTILCDFIKKNSSMHPLLHSCGSIYRLLPDIIEAGFEAVNPVQTSCTEMEPERLKKEFGNDITFWGGGADTQKVLNRATPEEVKDHVKKRIDVFAPGGGFVFNTVHNILPEVPPENVIAMFEAIDEK